MLIVDPELPDPLIIARPRKASLRDRIAAFGMAIGITALVSAGCVDGTVETEAAVSDPAAMIEEKGGVAVSEKSPDVAEISSAAPGSGQAEAVYGRLLEQGRYASGDALLAFDERLKAAEAEYPLDFRFSYERARLVVFGRHDHHEAFARLRLAAEKAIQTGRTETMLEMLRSDATRDGPFWRLSRGHSEWEQTHDALEHRDRDDLWHEHIAETAVRTAPPPVSNAQRVVDRLWVARSRLSARPSELPAAPGVAPGGAASSSSGGESQ